MFGISFTEMTVIIVVALLVVGPQKLPSMLATLGSWIRKVRKITADVRQQTGIDEILRQEGLHGGLNELRGMLRVDLARHTFASPPVARPVQNPYASDNPVFDPLREYPPEGVDAFGALPDDLIDDFPEPAATPILGDPATLSTASVEALQTPLKAPDIARQPAAAAITPAEPTTAAPAPAEPTTAAPTPAEPTTAEPAPAEPKTATAPAEPAAGTTFVKRPVS